MSCGLEPKTASCDERVVCLRSVEAGEEAGLVLGLYSRAAGWGGEEAGGGGEALSDGHLERLPASA